MSEQLHTDGALVLTAMITPFNHGYIDYEGAQEMARYLLNHGSDGLVLAGTTGESPVMSHDQQIDLFRAVREAVGNGAYLIGGTGSNNTEEAMMLTERADARGDVDALLVVSPYYNRPSQFGIADYYRKLAGVTDLPRIAYNIPVRTGRAIEEITLRELLDEGTIQGLKDATGSTLTAERLIEDYDEDITVYSGDDSLNLEFYKVGAAGAISVASHWSGWVMQEMYAAAEAGDFDRAEEIDQALKPSYEFESSHTDADGVFHDTPNPGPAKVMMRHILGPVIAGTDVSPMVLAPEEEVYLGNRARQILEDLADFRRREGI